MPWGKKLPTKELLTYIHMLYHENPDITLSSLISHFYDPSQEDIEPYNGKVLVITDFVQGNFFYEVVGYSVMDRDFHECMLEKNPTVGYYRNGFDFSLQYVDEEFPNRSLAGKVIEDPVEIWRFINKTSMDDIDLQGFDLYDEKIEFDKSKSTSEDNNDGNN